MLKHCFNPKVIIGVVVIIALAYFFVPNLASYSGILIALICPLSMLFMMGGMKHGDDHCESHGADAEKINKEYVCSECGRSYKDIESAKNCAKMCKK